MVSKTIMVNAVTDMSHVYCKVLVIEYQKDDADRY